MRPRWDCYTPCAATIPEDLDLRTMYSIVAESGLFKKAQKVMIPSSVEGQESFFSNSSLIRDLWMEKIYKQFPSDHRYVVGSEWNYSKDRRFNFLMLNRKYPQQDSRKVILAVMYLGWNNATRTTVDDTREVFQMFLKRKEARIPSGIVALLAVGRYVLPLLYNLHSETLSPLFTEEDLQTPVVLDVLKQPNFIQEIILRVKSDMKRNWIQRLALPGLGLKFEGVNHYDKLMDHDAYLTMSQSTELIQPSFTCFPKRWFEEIMTHFPFEEGYHSRWDIIEDVIFPIDFSLRSFDVLQVYNSRVSNSRPVLVAIKHMASGASFEELEDIARKYILRMLREVAATTFCSTGVAVITISHGEMTFYAVDRGGIGSETLEAVPVLDSKKGNKSGPSSIYWTKDKDSLAGYLDWYKKNVTM